MSRFMRESFVSFAEFQSFSNHKNKRYRDVFKSTGETNEATASTRGREEETVNTDFGLTVVPFARSSKTVRRQNSFSQVLEEDRGDDNISTAMHPILKRFPWETIGHARREQSGGSGDGIRVEYVETKPFPFGVFGSKVVATRDSCSNDSPTNINGITMSRTINTEDLPHPSKLRKRKRASKARPKKFGIEVDTHLALLRRKHVEFNWTPKALTSPANCTAHTGDQEEVLQERMSQKVPNTSPPLSRKHPRTAATPAFYIDSPPKPWLSEYTPSSTFLSTISSTDQDQILPQRNDLLHRTNEHEFDTSDDDFHLNIENSIPSDFSSHTSDDDRVSSFLHPSTTRRTSCWVTGAQNKTKEE